jgi:mRNA interferase MazF
MIRGEIWWADLGLPFGSEPGFRRPVLIVQADAFNRSMIATCVVVPFTTNLTLADAPGNVHCDVDNTGLTEPSVAVVSQLTAIDKRRLTDRHSALPHELLRKVDDGIRLVLDLE